jgi:hypothetical protein
LRQELQKIKGGLGVQGDFMQRRIPEEQDLEEDNYYSD